MGLDNFNDYYDISLKNRNAQVLADSEVVIMGKDLRDVDLCDTLPKDIQYSFHFAAQPGISLKSNCED